MTALMLAFVLCADLHLSWEGGDRSPPETVASQGAQEAADAGGTKPTLLPASASCGAASCGCDTGSCTCNCGGDPAKCVCAECSCVPRRYTRAELTKLANEHAMSQPLSANGNRMLAATVNPWNQVWNHLKNEHGFSAEQVDGLSFNQAKWLHSGAHAGVIKPMRPAKTVEKGQGKVFPVIDPRYELRKFCGPNGCYWQRVRVN
jgi:hypothetical protein